MYEVVKHPFPNIKLTPITTKEIKDIIKSLQQKNSQGYDEIPLKILKINMPFIVLCFVDHASQYNHVKKRSSCI
jgi:hypothetical protein